MTTENVHMAVTWINGKHLCLKDTEMLNCIITIYFVLIGEIKTFPPALDVYLSVCLLALLVFFFLGG